jgi:hypothetical protein
MGGGPLGAASLPLVRNAAGHPFSCSATYDCGSIFRPAQPDEEGADNCDKFNLHIFLGSLGGQNAQQDTCIMCIAASRSCRLTRARAAKPPFSFEAEWRGAVKARANAFPSPIRVVRAHSRCSSGCPGIIRPSCACDLSPLTAPIRRRRAGEHGRAGCCASAQGGDIQVRVRRRWRSAAPVGPPGGLGMPLRIQPHQGLTLLPREPSAAGITARRRMCA